MAGSSSRWDGTGGECVRVYAWRGESHALRRRGEACAEVCVSDTTHGCCDRAGACAAASVRRLFELMAEPPELP